MTSTPTPTFFKNPATFRVWLEANAFQATELWVGFYKVGSGRPSMTWPESVDEALCFGWIDGVRRRIDDRAYMIRFTPRKPTSVWSAINIAKVAQLEAQGRMMPAGMNAYALRSEARSVIYSYEQAAAAELSADEVRAFNRQRKAWRYFESAPPGYKKLMLHRVTSAKRSETRVARLAKLIAACAAGERLA